MKFRIRRHRVNLGRRKLEKMVNQTYNAAFHISVVLAVMLGFLAVYILMGE